MPGLQTIEALVRTSGTLRDVTAASFESEIPGAGPASLPAGGALTAATGTLTLEDDYLLEGPRSSPWLRRDGWPPRMGDPVEVEVDHDGTVSTRFTGVVEDAEGAATEPVTARVVSPVDQLHRPYTSEPITRPSFAVDALNIGGFLDPMLRPEHHVTRALRQCGYHVTAEASPLAYLHVPMSGSLLAEKGRLVESPLGQASASWGATPFGLGLRGATARWELPAAGNALDGYSFDLVVYVAPGSGTAETKVTLVAVSDDLGSVVDAVWVGVAFPNPTTLQVRVSWNAGASWTTVSTPYRPLEPWVRVLRPGGGANARIWHGQASLFNAAAPNPPASGDPIRHVKLSGVGARIGSLYLGEGAASEPVARTTVAPNAFLKASPLLTRTLDATPYIDRRDTLDLLRDIAKRTLSDMWIDTRGRFHWAGVGALAAQAPAHTLTSTADLLNLSWEESLTEVRRRVSVTCESPAVTLVSHGTLVPLWEGSDTALEAVGDTATVWATAPSGTDWIDARTPTRITSGTLGSRASYMGGVVIPSSGSPTLATTAQLVTTAERVTSQSFKVEHRVTAIPNGATIRTRGLAHTRPDLNEAPLPRIVGSGRVDWSPMTHTSALEGPDAAGDYDHDAGPWVQGADCAVLADWIAQWVTAPGPILRELPIIYHDDLKLGDVVDVVEDAVYHLRARAVVVGMSESHVDGSSDMTVTLRVLALSAQEPTLGTYDQVWAGGTLADLDSEWAGETLADHDADPLRRS